MVHNHRPQDHAVPPEILDHPRPCLHTFPFQRRLVVLRRAALKDSGKDANEVLVGRAFRCNPGRPDFNLKMVALAASGQAGCCAVRGTLAPQGKLVGLGYSVDDTDGQRLESGEAILPPLTDEERVNLPLR